MTVLSPIPSRDWLVLVISTFGPSLGHTPQQLVVGYICLQSLAEVHADNYLYQQQLSS